MTIEERLEKLEREFSALRAELAKRVQTRCLHIVDENGKLRAQLGLEENCPVLLLSGENGKPRAGLIATKDGRG